MAVGVLSYVFGVVVSCCLWPCDHLKYVHSWLLDSEFVLVVASVFV